MKVRPNPVNDSANEIFVYNGEESLARFSRKTLDGTLLYLLKVDLGESFAA